MNSGGDGWSCSLVHQAWWILAGGFIPRLSGGQRVAMRKGTDSFLLLADHLGSASVSYNVSTHLAVRERYKPWGELRDGTNSLPTNYTYTGQYSYAADFGLMFYGARWYDPSLNRWTQPDTIVPLATQGIQAFDRYAYSNNNPATYNDPTGHWIGDPYDPSGAENAAELRQFNVMATQGSVFTTDLDKEAIKQYEKNVTVNGTAYQGRMACGIAAGCAAGASWEEMSKKAVTNGWDPVKGMQPSQLDAALEDAYGSDNVASRDNWTLDDMYNSLADGQTVIVDIQVSQSSEFPSTEGAYAHFAAVRGIDWTNKMIYIENSLSGGNYWRLTFDEFMKVWYLPERDADILPRGLKREDTEDVNNWAVTVDPD